MSLALAAGTLGYSADPVCSDLLVRKMHGVVSAGQFNDFRGIGEYQLVLGETFTAHLARLVRGNRWLDVGAGHARAQKEYLLGKRGFFDWIFKGRADVVAVAAKVAKPTRYSKMVDTAVEGSRKFLGLFGRYVEDIPDQELGRADVITDVFGAISYSERVDAVLNKYLRVLNAGGSIYIHTSPEHTKIIRKDGTQVTLVQWLDSVDGLAVKVEAMSIVVTPTRVGVVVPTLKLVGGKADVPPERVFQEV
ncbi:MAG: hypothetical protein HY074_11365 [Deltaproteobacteria bacterium]|nr:hypothetical protein [Deltaproteobacteria bacterium]